MSEPEPDSVLPPFEMPDEDMVPFLRAMTPTQRLAKALELHDLARHLVATGVQMRRPEWNEDQVLAEVGRIMNREPA